MIVYKELSSLVYDLGFSSKTLYSVSNHISSHYHKVEVPKGNGEYRRLSVPDELLKAIQKKIVSVLLVHEEISPYATAYRFGGSTVANANPHLGAERIMKLDIRHFFDKIIYPMVKQKVFTEEKYSEANSILLSILCVYKDSLPQGAPTSPIISNIIMKDFDNKIGKWCENKGITYTRYCDDLTFSGEFIPKELIEVVKSELGKMGLYLNNKKTVVAGKGQKKQITGIVVNEKLNTPINYKRKLRQELFYCRKYGVESHLKKKGNKVGKQEYLHKLLGKVNYVLSVDKDNMEMQEYKQWIKEQLNT